MRLRTSPRSEARSRMVASSAASSHGATLESWSSRVQMISSPGCRSWAMARVIDRTLAVVDGPNTKPSGSALRKSPIRRRARSTSASQASAAASKGLELLSQPVLQRDPGTAHVRQETCAGCFECLQVCPYQAIEKVEIRDRDGRLVRMVASSNPAVCEGCGGCTVTCRSGNIDLWTVDRTTGAIHQLSRRRKKPFVAVNCGALPEQLLESELFGHVKGAFTGAMREHTGLFRAADGGTLFLDEIGDMPLELQAKLLRVLQEKEITRTGGSQTMNVDVRIVAATNQNISELVEEKKFREDLYYRLNVVHIALPPLKDRQEDIRLLVNHFIDKYAHERKVDLPVKGVDQEVDRLFFEYSWPGNVRELENVIERAFALGAEIAISVSDLPMEIKTFGDISKIG